MSATQPQVPARSSTHVRPLDDEVLKNRVRNVRGGGVDVKVLTSCPPGRRGLARFSDDTGARPDYIVLEMARHLLAEHWREECVPKSNAGGTERVLL